MTMTTAQNIVNSPYSRAIIERKVSFKSLQAQRVMNRSFDKLKQALFSISVILPIISQDEEEIESITAYIDEQFSSAESEINSARDQISKILEDNGIEQMAQYSKPEEFVVELDTPKAGTFLRLVSELDLLMGLIDTAWLSGEFDDKQKKNSTFQYQQRLIKLAGKLISLEKRARVAASKRGKGDEVEEKAPVDNAELHEDVAAATEEAESDMPLEATG
jgi:hypothetical protein